MYGKSGMHELINARNCVNIVQNNIVQRYFSFKMTSNFLKSEILESSNLDRGLSLTVQLLNF